jgi:hypothetical protein
MSEPGKVEERRSTDMSLYHLLRKAGNGFGFRHTTGVNARLQTWSLKQEKVLVNHVTGEQEARSFGVVVHLMVQKRVSHLWQKQLPDIC